MSFQNDNSAFYGGNIGSVKADRVYDNDTVYLNMPPNLSTTYQSNYRTVDLGVGGIALANAAANVTGEINFDDLAAVSYTHLTLPTNREV